MRQLCVCRDIEHLGSLESTRLRLVQLLRLFRETPTSVIIIVTAITIRSVSATPTLLLAKIAGGSCWRRKG